MTELLRREKRLKQREEALEEKEKALEIAHGAIETRLAVLQQAEQDLRETLALANKAAETDLTRLTDVYQNMKPKDAAALFETMDPSFAAGFLSRMPPMQLRVCWLASVPKPPIRSVSSWQVEMPMRHRNNRMLTKAIWILVGDRK